MKKARPKTGIHPNIPEDVYHGQWDALHHSGLLHIHSSPAHFKHRQDHPKSNEPTKSMNRGRVIHCAVLTPDVFTREYCYECTDHLVKEASRDEWADKYFILGARLRDAVYGGRNQYVKALLEAEGVNEVSFAWDDPDTGIRCCGRTDRLIPLWEGYPTIVSLKTTEKPATEYRIGRYIQDFWAHTQAAYYRKGLETLTLAAGHSLRHRRHLTVMVETAANQYNGVLWFEMDEEALEQGRRDVDRWLRLLAHCREHDEWPGYSATGSMVTLPKYMMDDAPIEVY